MCVLLSPRLVSAVVVAAVAFQTSEFTRFVYTWLDLAPGCPIVGVDSCYHEIASCHVSLQVVAPGGSDDCSQKSSDTPQTPSDDGRQCRTCQMFTSAQTASFVLLDATILFDDVTADQRDMVECVLTLDTIQAAHARAPPFSHAIA